MLRSSFWLRALIVAFALLGRGVGAESSSEKSSGSGLAAIPVRNFFRSPALYRPVVNRSGTRVAALVDGEDDLMGVRFFDLAGNKQTGFRGSRDSDIDEVHWLDDTHVLMSTSHEKIYAEALTVVDVTEPQKLYAIERSSAVEILAVPKNNPMLPLVWIRRDAYDDGKDRGAVTLNARLTVDPKHKSILTPHNTKGYADVDMPVERYGTNASIHASYAKPKAGLTRFYLADRNGELAFAVIVDRGIETLLVLRDEKWVTSPLDLDRYDVLGAGDESDELIAVGPRQEGKPRAVVRVNATTGKETGVLLQDDVYDPDVVTLVRHPGSRQLIGVQLYKKSLMTVWLDEAHRQLQADMNALFPGKLVSLLGTDDAEKKLVVSVYSDRAPVEYHFIDAENKVCQRIASSAPWIEESAMQPMQTLSYKTRDGHKIEGYLTLPAGVSKEKPAPLVVLVHGGPWARDVWEWSGEVQFLASRGYAVFQPNYRGSTGYQWSFPAGDMWQFRKMHDDVTDGVKKLLKSGLVDPQRLAIMGASFGGYLAMCGAAYEPALYRCAITEAGVFDWAEMMQEAKRTQFESVRYQYYLRNLGDPKQRAAELAEMSPLNHLDQVKVPVLIAHGMEDETVSIEQSERLAKELERRHVPHRVLMKRGEAHGFSRLDHRVEFYSAVEAFLAENVSPQRDGQVATKK